MFSLKNAFQTWSERSRARRELEAMDDRAIEDMGLDRAALTEAMALPADVPQRMTAMADVFGADLAHAPLSAVERLDMARACGQCDHRRRCAEELAGPTSAALCSFCPNAATYSGLAQSQAA